MNVTSRKNPWLLAGCVVLCLYFFLIAPALQIIKLTDVSPMNLVDFEVFYKAGKKAFLHHTVYDVTGHWQFKYSPLIASIFGATLSQLEYPQAQVIFTLMLAILWPLLIYSIINTLERKFFKDLKFSSLEKMGLVLLFYGNSYLRELVLGQVNLIPFALLFSFFRVYSDTSQSDLARGMIYYLKLLALASLWSLAIQVKLFSVLIGAYLLFRKEFVLIALTLGVTFGLDVLLLSLFHNGSFVWSENLTWLKTLNESSISLITNSHNSSLLGFLSRVPYIQTISGPIWIASTLWFLRIQYVTRNLDPMINFALSLLAILLLNPLVWNYWTLLSIPAFLILIHQLSRNPILKTRPWVRLTFAVLFISHIGVFSQFSREYCQPIAHLLLCLLFMKAIIESTDFNLKKDQLSWDQFFSVPLSKLRLLR
jgi:hypothetical protein